MRALSAPVAGRGSCPRAASGGGDPVDAAGHHGVSGASIGLPGLWSSDARGMAQGIPTGGFGPRVQAITALCTGAYHLSKRTPQRVLEDLFGVSIGLGTVANLEQATVRAVAEPVAAARAYVQTQPAAYLDETGWREGRQRAWLWVATTTWVTVFVVRLSRRAKVAQEVLGGAVLGVVGHGSVERLYLVSDVAPAAVLGASVAGYGGHDRARRSLGGDGGSLAGASPPDVPLLASGSRWHAGPRQLQD